MFVLQSTKSVVAAGTIKKMLDTTQSTQAYVVVAQAICLVMAKNVISLNPGESFGTLKQIKQY
jgi:hypothetical protein